MTDDDWFERAFSDDVTDADDTADPTDAAEDASGPDVDGTGAGDDQGLQSTSPAFDTDAAGSPFDEDFSEAFDRAPSAPGDGARSGPGPTPDRRKGDEMAVFGGMDDFTGGEFDEEGFESNLERLDIGIEGLDDMILGGVPTRSLIAAIGSAGTGKTTIGMQFLNEALAHGDRGVLITLEESRERVFNTAAEKGWDFKEHEANGNLAVVDLDPVEMANSLAGLRNDLTRLIDDFGAERLVLDSVSLLEMMYDHPARRRSEVFQFTRALKRAGVTTLVTSEASDSDPYASRHGIIEYLADAVFSLQYVRSSNFQETRLSIEIQKIRDANHSRQPKPYEITNEGINVHQQATLF